VSLSQTTNGQITLLYILITNLLDSKWDDKGFEPNVTRHYPSVGYV